MKPVFDEVLIFSPSVKTGGPEALHQLGYQIARHGGSAKMVYYDFPFSMDGNVLRCGPGPFPMLEHFAQYEPQVTRETPLGANTLVVFPEPLIKAADNDTAPFQRALWWLSINNVFAGNPDFLIEDYRQKFFARPDILQLYQSFYARQLLFNYNAPQYFPLFDYTDPQFIARSLNSSENPPIGLRANSICFFPTKGGALAERFVLDSASLRHKVEFVAIRNMTKAEVRDTLFQARIYIDFGDHFGKDRVPREAAVAGAIVLLHAMGSANFFDDHPIPREYRFTQDDLVSGRLHQKVNAILDDPERHFAAQRAYRQTILLEREQFETQVRTLFFTGA
jgi:hypothetical protein